MILLLAAVTAVQAGTSCPELSAWIDSALDDGRIPVRRAALVWTGSEALIWGGEIGYRFDPSDTTWQVMSSDGAPGGYAPLYAWTGTELLVWGGTLSSATKVVDTSGGRYSPTDDEWSTITTVGAPVGRRDAASAWTGSEWVIWGGRDAAEVRLADGAVYDPSGDGWSSITATGAPAARYAHSMTWADGSVLLFGGRSGGTYFADLYSYNPVADSWTPLTSPPGEAGRQNHAAVWTGEYLLIYGGEQSGVGAVNTGWRYHASTLEWTAMATGGAPAAGATTRAAWSGTELIVWSGDGAAAGRYDPVSNTWAAVTATGAPSARSDHSVAWLDDRLMVWGGGVADGGTWDPVLDEWSPTDPVLPTRPMRNHVALWTGSEVLFWGGQTEADHALASGYRYSPATDSWAPITSVGAPSARRFHTAVWTGSEMIVWGGQLTSTPSVRLSDGARYDPVTDTWAPITTTGTPEARSHHAVVWTGDEMIVWGGWIGTGRTLTDTGGRYDPDADTWLPVTTTGAPEGRRDQQMVWTGDEMIVWSGGVDLPGNQITYPTTGAAYDPLTDSWSPIADAATWGIPGRAMAAAVWSGNYMLVWGGAGDPVTLADGARYDPVSDAWTVMSSAGAPGDRRKAVGVWTGEALLVHGGQSGDFATTTAYLDDGGFYLPSTDSWVPLPVEPALGPRSLHAGAWAGDRLVAFGGQSDGGTHNAGGLLLVGDDADSDGVCDTGDNCLGLANIAQLDADADGTGDACDVCPLTPDPDQADSDSDGTGDACEWCSDPDGDGACDVPSATAGDRCPLAFNPDPSGRKIVLTGSPFDGREVGESYLREAGDGEPLVVFEGDLETNGTTDLFTQRPLEGLELTSLGAASTAGPSGYLLEGIYDTVALFSDPDHALPLTGVKLEGGAPPNRVDPQPGGYQISRGGTKIVFPWTSQTGPCEFSHYYLWFATIDTTTGSAHCYGVDYADQEIADWDVSSDRSWVFWVHNDYNSAVGSASYARHLDLGTGGTLDASALPGDVGIPTPVIREDGLALVEDRFNWNTSSVDVESLRVGSSVKTLATGGEYGPRFFFSDQGDGVAILFPVPDPGPPYTIYFDLLVGSLTADGTLTVQSPSLDDIGALRFAPGETHFAFTDGASPAFYVAPVASGGPVIPITTAGNTIVEFGFTADATTLLFTEERSGDLARELWAVSVDGGAPAAIGPVPAAGADGVSEWAFAGDRLIVLGNFAGSLNQLYSMELDGSDVRQIEFGSPYESVTDFWIFDGGIVMRVDPSPQLWLAPANGGRADALTMSPVETGVSDPQIARDGSFLIYDASIAYGDRESVIYFADPPDQDSDGILDPCDCLPADPAAGQSPGLVELVFTGATTLSWPLDGVSTAWTIYRGDLAAVPGDEGVCLVEGHGTPSYVDSAEPSLPGSALVYLIAGESACGTGQVGPRSDGSSRNVSCP